MKKTYITPAMQTILLQQQPLLVNLSGSGSSMFVIDLDPDIPSPTPSTPGDWNWNSGGFDDIVDDR